METRYLESFVLIVELKSIAEAARRLNLTPAAVKQRIEALEAELSTPLLTRAGRTVRPTEAGYAIYRRASPVLRAIGDLKDAAMFYVDAGELRLGAVSTAMTGILPQLLTEMDAQYPEIAFFVTPGTSSELYNRVVDGGLDAAIIVAPPFDVPKDCGWFVIREEPLLLISPAGMPANDPVSLLRSAPFLRYDRNRWGGLLADSYLKKIGVVPNHRFELDALEAIAVMVDRGLGISLVPDWTPLWPQGLALEKHRIDDPECRRQIGVIWNRASLKIRLINALLKHLS